MSTVHRFIAASVAKMPGSVIEQLLAMRRGISHFNAHAGLRTALLYTGGWFVQWHEGAADAIERTWQISRSHAGHSHARVVHRSTGLPALAETVQIAALAGPDRATDVARKLFELEALQRERDLEPAQVWRWFASPPAGRFAHRVEPDPHRAVALVSEYTEAVELVKALSERSRVPMNYQRFAGPDLRSADAGAAYIDVGFGGRRTRVQAISRHVLHLSLARLAFARVHDVVVLANRRGETSSGLADVVRAFADALRPEPAFHVAGLHGRNHLDAIVELVFGPESPNQGEQ